MSDPTQNKPEVTVRGFQFGTRFDCGRFDMELFLDGNVKVADMGEGSIWMDAQTFLALADALRNKIEGPAVKGTVKNTTAFTGGPYAVYVDAEVAKEWLGTEVEIRKVTS